MKSFYKSILAFILFAVPFDLFAQHVAVGAYFSYNLIDKYYFDQKSFGLSCGTTFSIDFKENFSFQTGLLYSRKYSYAEIPARFPLIKYPNIVYPEYPFYWPYYETFIYKSLVIPLSFSYRFYSSYSFDLYVLMGTRLLFRLNEYVYGEQYFVVNDTTFDYTPEPYNYTPIQPGENKFKFEKISGELGIGGAINLSDHIKAGIEVKANYYPIRGYRDVEEGYFLTAFFAKYYFEAMKRPNKE